MVCRPCPFLTARSLAGKLTPSMGVLAMLACWLGLAGCDERSPTRPGSAVLGTDGFDPLLEDIEPSLLEVTARADYSTSPPTHPTLAWRELAAAIEHARGQLELVQPLVEPERPDNPLAERSSTAQMRAVTNARHRLMVLRAEAARLLATGDVDGAAVELVGMLDVPRALVSWGVPVAAEAAAEGIEMLLNALDQPAASPLRAAISPEVGSTLRASLRRLDASDPAGRMRAMVESTMRRTSALRRHAEGRDGPTAVRAIASRYRRGAVLAEPELLGRLLDEADAFARALADGWDKPTRSAITERLRQRQGEDETGVLLLLLGDAPEACDADARLRERIDAALETLQ